MGHSAVTDRLGKDLSVMKKLLVLLLALLIAALLAACGNGDNTTPTTTDSTAPTAGSSTPEASGTEAPVSTTPTTTEPPVTTEPLLPGTDILNGDFENMAINPSWQGANACAFEEHVALDFHVALVVQMIACDNGIYEQLILTTDPDSDSNQTNWELNADYRWVVEIDGEEIEIERFSILNDQVSGYVRMDLGADWTYSDEVDEDGYHSYDIWLKIYDDTQNKLAFWAYLTDPNWNGSYDFAKPEPIVMIDDENRDPSHIALPADSMTPLAGPAGMSNETYNYLFDGNVRSKLCTNNTTDPIDMMFDDTVHIVSYSIVNANDNETYPERTLLEWKLYGSMDGAQWTEIDSQSLTEADSTNYLEHNFVLDEEAEYKYFRFEPIVTAMYQLSEIVFYTTAEYME